MRRGGVKRISGAIYPFTRYFITHLDREFIRKALHSMHSAGRKTISTKDVVFALEASGRHVYGSDRY